MVARVVSDVAITRARSELVVFATLKPDQIDLSRTKSAGVLYFNISWNTRSEAHVRWHKQLRHLTVIRSRLSTRLQKALEDCGWNLHPQVGVAGFRVEFPE